MKSWVAIPLLSTLVPEVASAQVTQCVSLSAAGSEGTGWSYLNDLSGNGRYVTFVSIADNLVPGDTNSTWDVFLRDRRSGMTERISVDSAGAESNAQSVEGLTSANGRFVVFTSWAANLVPGDTNGVEDAFLRDRLTGLTERISLSWIGSQANGACGGGPITPDGRYVVFGGLATNLIPQAPSSGQIYIRDRLLGTTELVSVSNSGALPSHASSNGTISDDGRYVAFVSLANNLVPGDTNGDYDVFVRDRQNATTVRVNVSSNGAQANGTFGFDINAKISAGGRFVTFEQGAFNLVPGDTNFHADSFVRDLQLGTTERVSIDSNGVQGNGDSGRPTVSGDGRYIAFWSDASNLVPGDTNGTFDAFVRDRLLGTTERVSLGWGGGEADNGGESPAMSADGRYVAFSSLATDLVPGAFNGHLQVFVRDRLGGTDFTSLCEPGLAGVIPCPCLNPSGGFGQGCDNSSSTGGALLTASGGAYLSSDSLAFTTLGARPSALSVLTQWTRPNPAGVVFGQGVRCAAGTLKRLYTKSAVGGIITAPDFRAGDLQVSVRSAALGDTIVVGRSRWYVVYYRDGVVLGGCPATSTFNATQTGQVTWSP